MKRWICAVVLVAMALMLVACSGGDEWEYALQIAEKMGNLLADEQLEESTRNVLDCIIADDLDGAYAVCSDVVSHTEFEQAYEEMRSVLEGVTAYTLTPSNKHANMVNGVSSVSIRYMMTDGSKRIFVDVRRTEGYSGLTGLSVYEYVPVTETGTLTTMDGANGLQWIVLLLGAAELGFIVWMFVDCCRHRVKKKWLWLLLIALGVAAVSATVENGVEVQYNLGLYTNLYTMLVFYSSGGVMLRLMLPVGAVIYIIMRKKLFRDAREQPEASENQEAAQQPEASGILRQEPVPDKLTEEEPAWTAENTEESDGSEKC